RVQVMSDMVGELQGSAAQVVRAVRGDGCVDDGRARRGERGGDRFGDDAWRWRGDRARAERGRDGCGVYARRRDEAALERVAEAGARDRHAGEDAAAAVVDDDDRER